MEQRTAPNWDEFVREKMFIPCFIYGRDDVDVGPFEGFCRGHGVLGGHESYQDTIGIYTAEGVYHNIVIDTRVECIMPMFFINDKPFFYPIVACFTLCGGLPAIDPATRSGRLTARRRATARNSNW